ncbi:MAG: hypothetical protein ACW98Y_09200 [Candidatus Thorarchaeota archaeon]|jgi:hypothetical protein
MPKIDDIFPDVGVIAAMIIVTVIGIALQLSGAWITMIIAGGFAGLFTRRHRHSFLAGFLGVALAWTILFIYLILTAQAIAVGEFFINLLGISGGALVIAISILLGALLGGFGGVFGRSVIELLDEILPSNEEKSQPPVEPSAESEATE